VPGEAAITGLTSAAQPFIRYRTGDIVTLSHRDDPGGRGLHVLETVSGRQTDFVVAADGTIMHALAVIYVLRAVEGVERFKCIQHSPREMEVLVMPGARWQASAESEIVNGLRARLGGEVAVKIELVDHIAPEASGKHRYVVSHVKPAGALAQACSRD
jgi:phenylacetate-CoA ligase